MASAKLEGESAKWTKSEVDIFVSVMVDEVIKGNKTSSTFNKAGWENIKNDCETKIGRPFSLRQLRNKMNKLRTDYGSFKWLLEQSGFGWCEKSGTAVPGNPAIWDDHIKANPARAKWKKQGLPQWPQLCQIFVDSYATGEGGISNTQEHTMIGDDNDVEESDSGQSNAAKQPPNTIHKLDRTPSALRKKSKHGDLAMAINRMIDVSQAKLELFTSSGTSTSTASAPPTFSAQNAFTQSNCVVVLEGIEGLSREMYMKAIIKVTEVLEYKELLITFPAEKKIWLIESWQ